MRVCAACKKQIRRHDKYMIFPEGTLAHRDCEKPTEYPSLEKVTYPFWHPSDTPESSTTPGEDIQKLWKKCTDGQWDFSDWRYLPSVATFTPEEWRASVLNRLDPEACGGKP